MSTITHAPLTSEQIGAGLDTIIITASDCRDEQGRALHTNLNFGGRFGHGVVYHHLHGREIDKQHAVALKLDAHRDWEIGHGRSVVVTQDY